MDLTAVSKLFEEKEKFAGKEVTVGGWIKSIRDSKTFGFIVLSDGTCFDSLQIVYHDSMPNFSEISKLNVGSAASLCLLPRRNSLLRYRRARFI